MNILYLFFGALVCGANALYTPSDDVVILSPGTFTERVLKGDEIWVVEFFAPWCGHCRNLVPEYKKAATGLKGIVRVGAIDLDEHKGFGSQYGVKGFPTIKIFGHNKQKPIEYQGQRTAKGIAEAAMKAAQSAVNEKMGMKQSSGSGGSGGKGAVVELTDSNFDKTVLESDDMWLVEFFAPWCGHCKNLEPHWAEAAKRLEGKVKLGALDATVHNVKSSQYGVQGFPTIKMFYKGEVSEYDGGRTAGDIVSWAEARAVVNIPAPEVAEVTQESVFNANCKEHSICVIAILPHILDCQSECRKAHIAMLNKLGDKYKQRQWGWIWAQSTSQESLEKSLEIGGFGYPALAVLNSKKMQFAPLRGSFSYDGINEFLRAISYGRGRTTPVAGGKLPTISKNEPWDGKDGKLPEEEDIDLSDVDLDDEPQKTEL